MNRHEFEITAALNNQDEEEALQTAREEPILSDEFYDANDNEMGEEMNDKELYQYDLDLCSDSRCWRFEKNAPKCTNCPYIPKDKYQERVQRINIINACRSQNKLK